MLQQDQLYRSELEKWSNQIYQEPETAPEDAHMFDLDCFLSNTSDTLFTMTQKPCPWSSDWHNTHSSNADMIQPALTPLQPNLDDFMDIPDIFMNYRLESNEQTSAFADCAYFDGPAGGTFGPPGESSGIHLSQGPSSIPRPDQARSDGDCEPFQFPGIVSPASAAPYGQQQQQQQQQQQLYPDPPGTSISPGNHPFLYPPPPPLPPPCHKYTTYLSAAATSTVITHTHASSSSSSSSSLPSSSPPPPPRAPRRSLPLKATSTSRRPAPPRPGATPPW
ncbi:hypothetical protein CRUP_017469 [Coryphaenoides rupestris]|nr:hypothetical protein CRUP_017469 [Coryphaenoides rupestris]